jgi:hypothetical protein
MSNSEQDENLNTEQDEMLNCITFKCIECQGELACYNTGKSRRHGSVVYSCLDSIDCGSCYRLDMTTSFKSGGTVSIRVDWDRFRLLLEQSSDPKELMSFMCAYLQVEQSSAPNMPAIYGRVVSMWYEPDNMWT